MTRRRVGLSALAVTLLVALHAGAADTPREFLRQHWRRPIAPQGPAPSGYTPIEASLHPEACGTCHPTQFADWRTSLHSRAMGPGVAGQLVEMIESDPGAALACQNCHAPLAEQKPLLVGPSRAPSPNSAFDATLRAKGLACAGCHVRGHERFGPPRRAGTVVSTPPRETLPHHGVTRTSAFLKSEFCRGCHQFEPGDFALNGKLLENTYNEWKASRFARSGVQCQDCHMPDRRHLWRGIHDPDMVRGGLTITLTPGAVPSRAGGMLTATLKVENTGVGHAFPTYVTPRVVMSAELLDASGTVLAGSRQERVIERNIELDLSRENSDTRLGPGQAATLRYRQRIDRSGLRARFSVVVYPDAFYTRFFESLLQAGAGKGSEQIREALEHTRRSPFTVFVKELPLTSTGP